MHLTESADALLFCFVFIFIDCSCHSRLNHPNFASFEQHLLPARAPFEWKTYPVCHVTWKPVAADDFLHPGTEVAVQIAALLVLHNGARSRGGAGVIHRRAATTWASDVVFDDKLTNS